jgi:hypothetical protein
MILLKKCDADNLLLVNGNKSRPSFRPVRQADRVNPPEIKQDGLWAGRQTFVEDFTQEHSLAGLHFTSIEVSGSF